MQDSISKYVVSVPNSVQSAALSLDELAACQFCGY